MKSVVAIKSLTAISAWFCNCVQVFFPLAPGIESIWEPLQEEVEERLQEAQRQFDEVVEGEGIALAMSLSCAAIHLLKKCDLVGKRACQFLSLWRGLCCWLSELTDTLQCWERLLSCLQHIAVQGDPVCLLYIGMMPSCRLHSQWALVRRPCHQQSYAASLRHCAGRHCGAFVL